MTFNEITKKAVQAAFGHARDIDQNLVAAQQTLARLRSPCGLPGFSPPLWDKVRRGLPQDACRSGRIAPRCLNASARSARSPIE